MNLIQFTFANIFDFKSVMDSIKSDDVKGTFYSEAKKFHASNSDNLQIVFKYTVFTGPVIRFVNSICTPTAIEDLREHTNYSFTNSNR